MNIQQYMANPMGKGSSVTMLKDTQNRLNEQYKSLKSKIRLTWYKVGDKYFVAHIKIPSSSQDEMLYDVLLEFNDDTIKDNISVIKDASVRVFSNCPSFTYTYAYVFYKNKDLIEWARTKYRKEILTQRPAQRNAYEIRNYERSLYLAIRFMLEDARYYRESIDVKAKKVRSPKTILANIASDVDIQDRHNQIKALSKKKKDEKRQEKQKVEKRTLDRYKKKEENQNRVVAKTAKTKTTTKTSKTKTTKKI